jgi:hypothetical protein
MERFTVTARSKSAASSAEWSEAAMHSPGGGFAAKVFNSWLGVEVATSTGAAVSTMA